ncbi:MAG: DUF6178 family protein, partial [Desulfobacterales bacterium]
TPDRFSRAEPLMDVPPYPLKVPSAGVMLLEQRHLLMLAPEDALDAVLDSSHAAALVQSFPEKDLHLLIHGIGVEDALPLLSMASDQQWLYMLDMEIWQGDRIDMGSFTRWIDHLMDADPDRLVGRFLDEHLEDMELYLFKNVQVVLGEPGQDPTGFGDGYFTLDGQFYIRFLDNTTDSESEYSHVYGREDILIRFLQKLAEHDYPRYQQILLEASSVSPFETEEELYRLRNTRLAEEGFIPFEEAIGVYQPLRPGEVERLSIKAEAAISKIHASFSATLPAVQEARSGNVFRDALARITTEAKAEQIQEEIADLSNQIASADRLKTGDRMQLDAVVQKATGYIGIGLETLINEEGRIDLNLAAALLEKFPLSHLFRVGYGRALKLKRQARGWHSTNGSAAIGYPLAFWGEHWQGVIDGLLRERPLFYDDDGTGALHREFSALKDIRTTQRTMDDITAVDKLLSLVSIPVPSFVPGSILSFKNLLLTLWARHHIGLPVVLLPISLNEFKHLFHDLWSARGPDPAVKSSMKESFLDWLSDTTGLAHNEIVQELEGVFDRLFKEVESEYGRMPIKHLDPMYVHLFLLKA